MEDYYISHHALVEAVNGVSTHWLNEWSTMGVLAMIDRQQAADVAPVVHGHWVDLNGKPVPWSERVTHCPAYSAYCSECRQWLVASDEYTVIGNYCPNCGAKMDLRADEGVGPYEGEANDER